MANTWIHWHEQQVQVQVVQKSPNHSTIPAWLSTSKVKGEYNYTNLGILDFRETDKSSTRIRVNTINYRVITTTTYTNIS
jgi:hypothetical protein